METNVNTVSNNTAIIKLQNQKKELTAKHKRLVNKSSGFTITIYILPILFLFFVWLTIKFNFDLVIIFLPIVYFLLVFAFYQSLKVDLKQLEHDIQEVDYQIELQKFKPSAKEQHAEKLFKMNQIQLRRYYDLNLGQNHWIFGLGIFCIVLGIVVIGISLFIIIKVAESLETQIITAALGAVGTILSNYIAAIYLKMNSSTTEILAQFHSRLVETEKLLLGNLVASRIEDKVKREDTLSKLSLCLVQKNEDDKEDKT